MYSSAENSTLIHEMPLQDIQDGVQVWPIPVAARSEAWVCGCSRAGIVGSNPAAGMDRRPSLVNTMCCQVEISVPG